MNVLDYVKSFLPTVETADLLNDIEQGKTELAELTLPEFRKAELFGNNYKFKHKWCKNRVSQFDNEMRRVLDRRHGMVGNITLVLETLDEHFEWIRSEAEKIEGDKIARDGMTYPAAFLIRTNSILRWFVRYSRKFLLCLYAYETDEYLNAKGDFPFSAKELKNIEDRFPHYLKVLFKLKELTPKRATELFDSIPNAVIDTDESDAIFVDRADPMRLGFIPYTWSPIYFIRGLVVDLQVSLYESAKAEKQSLELRKLQLQNAMNDTQDAAIEKQINSIESRLQNVNFKIAKTEEKYGVK